MKSPTSTTYLTFMLDRSSPSGKTQYWTVYSRRHGNELGWIRWYGPWRQYVFYPSTHTLFNRGCLDDIGSALAALMDERS